MKPDSSVRRAFGPLEKTSFIIIQIDGNQSATALQTARNLHKQLRELHLKPKSFYIEELDLRQIYLFFSEPVKTVAARALVEGWLQNNWFEVDYHAVSVLPNQAPLQIPVQGDFTWLNDDLQAVLSAPQVTLQNAVSLFMQELRANAVSLEDLSIALQKPQSLTEETIESTIVISAKASTFVEPENENAKIKATDVEQAALLNFAPDLESLVELAHFTQQDFSPPKEKSFELLVEPLVESTLAEILLAETVSTPDEQSLEPLVTVPAASPEEIPPFLELSNESIDQVDQSKEIAEPADSPPLEPDNLSVLAMEDAGQYPVNADTILTNTTARAGPVKEPRQKPNIRSEPGDYEQLMLPFESNTS